MPRSARDIQLAELKDTILKLNELFMSQTKSMDFLQKTIEDLRQRLSNKQAEERYHHGAASAHMILSGNF